jgi:hypothetical protein
LHRQKKKLLQHSQRLLPIILWLPLQLLLYSKEAVASSMMPATCVSFLHLSGRHLMPRNMWQGHQHHMQRGVLPASHKVRLNSSSSRNSDHVGAMGLQQQSPRCLRKRKGSTRCLGLAWQLRPLQVVTAACCHPHSVALLRSRQLHWVQA